MLIAYAGAHLEFTGTVRFPDAVRDAQSLESAANAHTTRFGTLKFDIYCILENLNEFHEKSSSTKSFCKTVTKKQMMCSSTCFL